MERVQLEVARREGTGKSVTRKLRAQGTVPAVLYGSGVKNVLLTVKDREAERAFASGSNTLIDLSGDPEVAGKLVLAKSLQRDPVSRTLVHCDFYVLDTSKKVHVSIPVHITGKPKGVELGGVLELVLREVEVSCLPLQIPNDFSLDVSGLSVGESLHASDLQLPDDVELLTESHLTVVHVLAPRVETAETPGADAAAAAAPAAEGA
jgi:large subunit ribosomal protein L25